MNKKCQDDFINLSKFNEQYLMVIVKHLLTDKSEISVDKKNKTFRFGYKE